MTISGLGTRRRTRRIPWLALVSGGFLLAALILLAAQLVRFANTHDVLQTDITVGGVPVGGLPLSEAVKRWETIYAQPVEVDYGNSPILLYPAQVGFFVKSDQLESQVESRAAGTNNYWTDFWNYLWQRPATPIDIPLAADYQTAKVRDFLNDVAARYEVHASGAHFDLSTMTFGSGANGAHIDIEAAIPLIDNALHSPTNRKVALPLKSEGASGANMQTLHDAILTYLQNADYLGNKGLSFNGPETVGGLVVIDLKSGAETTINADTAFSALSTIKIPILITRFSKLVLDPDRDTKWLMAASILCSSNSASNFLIQASGSGTDDQRGFTTGLQTVMDTMQALGAKNTFIDAPLYVGDKTLQFSIAPPKTNPDKQFNANPDAYSQTTPNDMATLLKELYDCAEYGSGLRAAIDPNDFTQTRCKQMIELLSGNSIGRLIELGVPPGTRVAQKNGWGGTQATGANVSDAGIVFSPGGDYILVVYIWEKHANQDGIGSLDTWRAVEGISRITYNYFNSDSPLVTPRVPENPLGAIDCVMPNPTREQNGEDLIDLNNISSGRFDAQGKILNDACVNYPLCLNKSSDSTPATPSPTPGA